MLTVGFPVRLPLGGDRPGAERRLRPRRRTPDARPGGALGPRRGRRAGRRSARRRGPGPGRGRGPFPAIRLPLQGWRAQGARSATRPPGRRPGGGGGTRLLHRPAARAAGARRAVDGRPVLLAGRRRRRRPVAGAGPAAARLSASSRRPAGEPAGGTLPPPRGAGAVPLRRPRRPSREGRPAALGGHDPGAGHVPLAGRRRPRLPGAQVVGRPGRGGGDGRSGAGGHGMGGVTPRVTVTSLAMQTYSYEQVSAVGWLRLNRPDRLNAMTTEMWAEMAKLGQSLGDDASHP